MAWFGQYQGTTVTGQWWGDSAAVVEETVRAGGGGGKRKKQIVEIRGKLFEVSGPREAELLLARAREAAQEAAEKVVRKAQGKGKAVEPVVPQLSLRDPDYGDMWTQQLQAQIDAANAAIADIYRRAAAEFAARMKQEREDDDVAALLLMGVL